MAEESNMTTTNKNNPTNPFEDEPASTVVSLHHDSESDSSDIVFEDPNTSDLIDPEDQDAVLPFEDRATTTDLLDLYEDPRTISDLMDTQEPADNVHVHGTTTTTTTTETPPTSTNPFEDETMKDLIESQEDEAAIPDLPGTSTNPFDDPTTTALLDPEIAVADPTDTPEACTNPIDDSNEQTGQTSTSKNPFDDGASSSAAEEGANPGKEVRDRFDCAFDDDSVQSMLEMMETKDDPKYKNKSLAKSLRNKAKGSMNKWRWKYLGGTTYDDDDDDNTDGQDEESVESYDCIALSSLKEKLRNFSAPNGDDDDFDFDIESLRSKPRSDKTDDEKSVGTTTTKNTTHGSDDIVSASYRNQLRRRRLKYMYLFATFFAILLLLGITVLSYSLYALRQEGEDENLSIFTRQFWREEVPKSLAFWKKDNDGSSDGNY